LSLHPCTLLSTTTAQLNFTLGSSLLSRELTTTNRHWRGKKEAVRLYLWVPRYGAKFKNTQKSQNNKERMHNSYMPPPLKGPTFKRKQKRTVNL